MANYQADNPLIVQGDHTILVEVASPRYEEARDGLARFAELVKAPEHVHTYRVTPLSVWNACAAGVSAAEIVATLQGFSKYPVPEHVAVEVRDFASRYGRMRLVHDDRGRPVQHLTISASPDRVRIATEYDADGIDTVASGIITHCE